MGETPSKTQLPMSEIAPGPAQTADETAFQRGLELGRDLADTAVRRIGAWAEEHPGQLLLAGLASGIVLGKLLFPKRRRVIEELD
ncbi:MAG: hypothetical protein ACXWLR_03995 [Myxococcales bacterium]